MPENNSLKPSEAAIVSLTAHEVSRLAILTVQLLASGDVDEAKRCAELCQEGRDLIAEILKGVSNDDRKALANQMTRQYTEKL